MPPRCGVHRVTTVTCYCMKPKQPHTKLHKASLPHLSPPSEIPSKAPSPRLARVLAWDATEIFPPLFLALGGVLGLLFAAPSTGGNLSAVRDRPLLPNVN